MGKLEEFFSFVKAKKWFIGIIGIVILFFLLRLILLQQPNTELTYKVIKENLVDTVQVSGTYTTASQNPVTSPSNGVIDQVFVHNNQQVQKNDPLFHVQSTATPDQQKAAYSSFLSASSTLQADTANSYTLQSTMYADWKKYTDIATNSTYQNSDGTPNSSNRVLTDFTTAQDTWLAAEASYKNQQSVIAKDQAAFSAAQQLYAETQSVTVTAPIAGTVENLLSQIGDQVSVPQPLALVGNTLSSSVAPVLVIVGSGNSYISTDVSEDYATRIMPQQKAYLVFDADKNKTLTGQVTSIAAVGNVDQGIVTYPARITIDDGQSFDVKPNMTALITVETLRKDNVLDVPNSAILTKGTISYVELAQSHKLIPVELGTRGAAKTEVVNGLSENSVILANPSNK